MHQSLQFGFDRPIHHPLETIDDMALMETIRDVIDEETESTFTPKALRQGSIQKHAKTTSPKAHPHRLKRQQRQRKLTYLDRYAGPVFDTLNIDTSNPNLRRRVSSII